MSWRLSRPTFYFGSFSRNWSIKIYIIQIINTTNIILQLLYDNCAVGVSAVGFCDHLLTSDKIIQYCLTDEKVGLLTYE